MNQLSFCHLNWDQSSAYKLGAIVYHSWFFREDINVLKPFFYVAGSDVVFQERATKDWGTSHIKEWSSQVFILLSHCWFLTEQSVWAPISCSDGVNAPRLKTSEDCSLCSYVSRLVYIDEQACFIVKFRKGCPMKLCIDDSRLDPARI